MTGVSTGEGDLTSNSAVRTKARLWGNGLISMISMAGAGEEDGRGGVVIISSTCCQRNDLHILSELPYHVHWPFQACLN